MRFAENVKKFRQARGLSQKKLALEVGVNQSMIAHIENGLRIPSLAVGFEISKALDVSLDELCKGA
ncbi:MAG: helix-turn-helix transcriptional regulator [Ruminococcus bromii]|nr:helix-turn-helix transcriptional regulator [Ruminococcus bromii]